MDRVAAEIAQEVSMFFEHQYGNSGSSQKEPSIMPAGPPPGMQHRTETSLASIGSSSSSSRACFPVHPAGSAGVAGLAYYMGGKLARRRILWMRARFQCGAASPA